MFLEDFVVSGFLKSLPPIQQRAINTDLLAFTPKTVAQYTQRGFMGFLNFTHREHIPVCAASLKQWSIHLQERNIAPTRVGWALTMLRIIAAAYDRPILDAEATLVTKRIHWHERAYKRRPTAKIRYGFSREDVHRLISNPPPTFHQKTWEYYVTLGWTFLLRSEEIRRSVPGDLREIVGPNKVKGFQLRVRNNKNTLNKNEEKAIFFPYNEIPTKFIPILRNFAQESSSTWDKLPSNNTIIRHLRKIIKIDDSTHEIVVHSFRHGRPADLILRYGYSSNKLAKVGRWHSASSVRIYSHV